MTRHEIKVNGKSITRNSKDRTYTHTVVGMHATGKVHIFDWCGSSVLAEKLARTALNDGRFNTPGWMRKQYPSGVVIVANDDEVTIPVPVQG